MREFDVVVWGATGFTGKLVCEHIVKNYQVKLGWNASVSIPIQFVDVVLDDGPLKLRGCLCLDAGILEMGDSRKKPAETGANPGRAGPGVPQLQGQIPCHFMHQPHLQHTQKAPSATCKAPPAAVKHHSTAFHCIQILAHRCASSLPCIILQDVPILIGDIGQPATMEKVAASTNVLLSTAGPYIHVGTPVVRACIAAGTHYADINDAVLPP